MTVYPDGREAPIPPALYNMYCAFCGENVEVVRFKNKVPYSLYYKHGSTEVFCDAICSEAWERDNKEREKEKADGAQGSDT